MKKLVFGIIIPLVGLLFFASCSNPRGMTNGKTIKRGDIMGKWVLNTISYDGISNNAKVTVFDEGNSECFKGSHWTLQGNWNGDITTYSNENGCTPIKRKIVWSIVNQGGTDLFQFKKLDEGQKGKHVTTGYSMNIESSSPLTMQLRAPVNMGSKTVYIIYAFNKLGK